MLPLVCEGVSQATVAVVAVVVTTLKFSGSDGPATETDNHHLQLVLLYFLSQKPSCSRYTAVSMIIQDLFISCPINVQGLTVSASQTDALAIFSVC